MHVSAMQSLCRGARLVLSLVLCVVLATCVAPATQPARAAGLPVIHWSDEGIRDLATLDPAAMGDWNTRLAAGFVFEGLVRQAPNLTVSAAAATRWTVSGDGRTYTFWLRPGLRFADGSTVTAADVVYSLDRALSPAFSRTANPYVLGVIQGAAARSSGRSKVLSGVQALAKDRVRITLTAPSGSFLARLALPAASIVPRVRILRQPERWTENAAGTGPFMVQTWQHGSALRLVPNPYYYGPRPRVAISLDFVPEPTTAFKLFQVGKLDVVGSIAFPADQAFRVEGDSQFHRSAQLATTFLALNSRHRPLDDRRVRLALAHALDKPPIVTAAFGSLAQATDGMLPPQIPGYDPHLHGAAFDPRLARALLAQAGYRDGHGFPTIVLSVDEGSQNLEMALALAQQWRSVLGIDVRLAQIEHNAFIARLTDLAFQISPITWTMDWPDPENFLTQQLHTGSHNNNGGWSNAEFDRLVDRADRLVGDTPERLSLYRRAEALAMQDAATIPLANPQSGILIRRSVSGLRVSGGTVVVPDWSRVAIGAV